MRYTPWRQCGWLWLTRWTFPIGLGLLSLLPAGAQGQYEAAVEAMGPPTISGPVITNKIAPPDFARFPNPVNKERVREARRSELAAATTLPPTPTEPTPLPGPGPVPAPDVTPEATPTEARPPAPMEEPEQVRLKAERFFYREGATAAEGNVEVRYQEITIHSEAAELDEDRIWGAFRRNVTLEARLYNALAEELRINLETEEFSAKNAAAEVKPEFFNGPILAPIYVRAAEVVGRPNRVTATEAIGTSCSLWPDPHWMLKSDRVTVVPEDRLDIERPTLYLFGRRLLRYPWDLHLSLRRRENRFLPEVGQNDVEGFYAKFSYGYVLNEDNTGFLRLNLTQKRGLGFGFDHILDVDKQWAELSVFAEPSQGSLSGRLLHRGQFSKPLSSNLNVSFQRNSGFGLGSESFSGDLTLRYDTTGSNSVLGFQQSLLTSSFSSSRRFSSNFSHRQAIGRTGSWEVRNTFHQSSFIAGQAADEELDTSLSWRQDFRKFTINLAANKRFDVDGGSYTGDNSYFTLNRIPDIVINTDSARLGDLRLFNKPFDATIYLGFFDQQPEDIQTHRAGIDFRLPDISREFGDRASLRTSARFRQMFYRDAAQWVGEAHAEYRLRLPSHWETRLRYSFAELEGFAPIRLDFASSVNVLYFEAARLVAERMRLNMSVGRDFENDYYSDAIFRGELMLSPRNRIELQTGYSIELSQFRPLNLRWIYATRRTWWSALTVNYDIDRSELSNVSLDADWSPSALWRVQFLGGFSSFGGVNQADVRITRDLHCLLAQLAYIHTTQEIRIGLGIKAFPSDTRTFGIGNRGQYFESNFEDVY